MSSLTPAMLKFIELERKKVEVKKYFEELNSALETLVLEVGVGTYFQDPVDGVVFKTIAPEGRYVHYEKFAYHRTKRSDEKRGDLSMKEAGEAGFTLA